MCGEEQQAPTTRCSYCRSAIARGVEPVACPSCHGLHHEQCLIAHGRCAACEAEHPRYRLVREARVRDRVGAGSRAQLPAGLLIEGNKRLSHLFIALVMIPSLGSFYMWPDSDEAMLGVLLTMAALFSLFPLAMLDAPYQTLQRRLGITFALLGLALLCYPNINPGTHWLPECYLGGAALLLGGSGAGVFGGRIAEQPGEGARDERS